MGSRTVHQDPALVPAPLPTRRLRRRLGWLLLLAVALALVLLYANRNRLLVAAAQFLDVSEPPQSTDYVMVLGGDVETRPFVAAALIKTGFARGALVERIKGFGDDRDGIVPPEQETIRAVLVHQGVPPDAVMTLPQEGASTFDEARALAEFLRSEPQSSVTVVTSCYHTRRTRWIFRKALGERSARVRFLGAPTDGFDASNWWHYDSGLITYLDEYGKLTFYLLRYSY
jgi:uncharacterized SAM-binding protein YcdF (DUF218 family)